MKYPKKLIEVALPLDDINAESAREKSIRHGHPSTLHLWWARRPLAAARAVLFAQLVNDPGGERGYGAYRGQTKADAQRERERLFAILRELVKWENINNEEVLERARAEIRKSWAETCKLTGEDPDKLPPFHDPFAGGGSIPLEAQRLGLEAHASDLNPVAVMINKAMIEIPPKFAGRKPVGPVSKDNQQTNALEDWSGARGLAEDVRRYGAWMREEAERRIGHLYPKVKIPPNPPLQKGGGEAGGISEATVIAWLWARTVASPNPAYSHVQVPLISSFFLSTKKGREAWIKPVVKGDTYRFTIHTSTPVDPGAVKTGTKLGRGGHFSCLLSGSPIPVNYIRAEGKAGRMGARLMAIVTEGTRGRIYLPPTREMEQITASTKSEWKPDQRINHNPRDIRTQLYGLETYADLFTSRQLVALTTFSDLVLEAREKVIADAKAAGWADDDIGLNEGGSGATAYGDAVAVYLAFAVDRCSNYWSSLTPWGGDFIVQTFGRQALPMVWDHAEANPFSNSTGNWPGAIEWVCKCLMHSIPAIGSGAVYQKDAVSDGSIAISPVISADPPYYDNISYADLSDFFYIWLRRSLHCLFPQLFSTLLVPKAEELIAAPYRHGGKEEAESFFVKGMTCAIQNMAENGHPAFPVTIYYAFKQSETKDTGTASTGWETFLKAVIRTGFLITGTWPMRTERDQGLKTGSNVLASSIVLVCRKRDPNTETISRRQFLRELTDTLPDALDDMIGGKGGTSPIAPVDLAQAAIGPGMAVFSKYAAVLEADGSPMSVHNALIHINKAIDEYFTQAEGEMDADTRFCVDWFQQYGFKVGPFGEANVLAQAKGTAVDGIARSGVLESGGGKVRLFKVKEYPAHWNPQVDDRVPVWEACHQLSSALQNSESAAGALLARMPEKAEPVRQLAYRLYTLCERKGWAEEARAYNALIASWHSIVEESQRIGHRDSQITLDLIETVVV